VGCGREAGDQVRVRVWRGGGVGGRGRGLLGGRGFGRRGRSSNGCAEGASGIAGGPVWGVVGVL